MPPKPKDSRDPWTRNKAASYLSLPPMPPPETTRPVTFCIPDHPDWRAALYGSISLMGSWLAWKRDEDHLGKDVAEVWRGIIQEAALAAERGEPSECMDWCAIIADCITSGGPTTAALNQWLSTNPEARQAVEDIVSDAIRAGTLPLEKRTGPLVTGVECSDGSIFKRTSTLVTSLHESITDLFQSLEVLTNPTERASKLISAIPGIGILPIDELMSYAESLANDVYENYLAAYNTALYDEIRCGLFCEFKDQCGFSLEECVVWYRNQFNGSIDLTDPAVAFRAILELVAGGIILGDSIVYAAHLLVLALVRSGQELFGLSFNTLALRIAADANEIDDDYLQLCQECAPPGECFSLLESLNGWSAPISGYLRWTVGKGAYRGGTNARIWIWRQSLLYPVTQIVVKWNKAYAGQADIGPSGNVTSYVRSGQEWVINLPEQLAPGWRMNIYTSPAVPNVPLDMYVEEICLVYA